MRGDIVNSLQTIFVLSSICCLVKSSGIEHGAQLVPAPVVTAASSQYFERTFNRLVALPQAVQPIVPVLPQQPVFVEPVTRNTVPTAPANTVQNVPVEPNIAIAIATAHAAAPVATFLLPPYPFAPPNTLGLVPVQPSVLPTEEPKREPTTSKPTTQQEVQTTVKESEPTTPIPSNSDNSFVQALPSNQNVNLDKYPPLYPPPLPTPPPIPHQVNANRFQPSPTNQNNNFNKPFNQYYAPNFPQAQLPKQRPQKLKTTVEIVPVPLAYIAPPPLKNERIILKHVHTYLAKPAKIIIRPMLSPFKIRNVRVPDKIVVYKMPLTLTNAGPLYPQNALRKSLIARDIEPTTFRPFIKPNTKPPKV